MSQKDCQDWADTHLRWLTYLKTINIEVKIHVFFSLNLYHLHLEEKIILFQIKYIFVNISFSFICRMINRVLRTVEIRYVTCNGDQNPARLESGFVSLVSLLCGTSQYPNSTKVPTCIPNLHGDQEESWEKSQTISMTRNQILETHLGNLMGWGGMKMKTERGTEVRFQVSSPIHTHTKIKSIIKKSYLTNQTWAAPMPFGSWAPEQGQLLGMARQLAWVWTTSLQLSYRHMSTLGTYSGWVTGFTHGKSRFTKFSNVPWVQASVLSHSSHFVKDC